MISVGTVCKHASHYHSVCVTFMRGMGEEESKNQRKNDIFFDRHPLLRSVNRILHSFQFTLLLLSGLHQTTSQEQTHWKLKFAPQQSQEERKERNAKKKKKERGRNEERKKV